MYSFRSIRPISRHRRRTQDAKIETVRHNYPEMTSTEAKAKIRGVVREIQTPARASQIIMIQSLSKQISEI